MTKFKPFNFKMNENTRTEIIGIFSIIICLWLLLYFIPEIFVTLFNTLLGNFILIILSILVISYNVKYGIVLSIIFIIIYRFSLLTREKEGFVLTNDPKTDFLLIQDTINPNKIYDVNMITRNQATTEELNYFNQNGIWPWSDETKDLYLQAITSNPYIKIAPDAALLETQTIYNEKAILMTLSYQTKEGKFLINGIQVPLLEGNPAEDLPSGFGDFAYESGLKPDRSKDVIRCNMDNSTLATLERIHYTGREGIYESQTATTSPVEYGDLENIIPGFKFVNGPCNPCGAIRENPDYSCPFEIKVKENDDGISSIWKFLWGL
jgi:hypothetical protein